MARRGSEAAIVTARGVPSCRAVVAGVSPAIGGWMATVFVTAAASAASASRRNLTGACGHKGYG